MDRRFGLVTVVPPIATFIAGVFVSIAFDFWKEDIVQTQGRFLVVAISAIILTGAALCLATGALHTHMLGATRDAAQRLDEIQKQLNLSAVFIDDRVDKGEGLSYERMAALVRGAKKSIRCVDFWVKPPDDHVKTENRRSQSGERRAVYYQALEDKMREFKDHGLAGNPTTFYKRVVQWERDDKRSPGFTVDPLYCEHLKNCLEFRATSKAAAIRVADPRIHMNFAIIDDRYVVWPVMITNLASKTVERIGAIMFTDPQKQVINCLMSIFRDLENNGEALDDEHLAP